MISHARSVTFKKNCSELLISLAPNRLSASSKCAEFDVVQKAKKKYYYSFSMWVNSYKRIKMCLVSEKWNSPGTSAGTVPAPCNLNTALHTNLVILNSTGKLPEKWRRVERKKKRKKEKHLLCKIKIKKINVQKDPRICLLMFATS